MKIETNKGQPCEFWIARLGSKAGSPLRKPYTSHNSFAVITNDPADYGRMMCAYLSDAYFMYKHGTVMDILRLRDVRKVAMHYQQISAQDAAKLLDVLELQRLLELKLEKTNELVRAIAKQFAMNMGRHHDPTVLSTEAHLPEGTKWGRTKL